MGGDGSWGSLIRLSASVDVKHHVYLLGWGGGEGGSSKKMHTNLAKSTTLPLVSGVGYRGRRN